MRTSYIAGKKIFDKDVKDFFSKPPQPSPSSSSEKDVFEKAHSESGDTSLILQRILPTVMEIEKTPKLHSLEDKAYYAVVQDWKTKRTKERKKSFSY